MNRERPTSWETPTVQMMIRALPARHPRWDSTCRSRTRSPSPVSRSPRILRRLHFPTRPRRRTRSTQPTRCYYLQQSLRRRLPAGLLLRRWRCWTARLPHRPPRRAPNSPLVSPLCSPRIPLRPLTLTPLRIDRHSRAIRLVLRPRASVADHRRHLLADHQRCRCLLAVLSRLQHRLARRQDPPRFADRHILRTIVGPRTRPCACFASPSRPPLTEPMKIVAEPRTTGAAPTPTVDAPTPCCNS